MSAEDQKYLDWIDLCLEAAEQVQAAGPGGRARVAKRAVRRLFMAARQLEGDACTRCGGTGTRIYGNGSTWRGGMGVVGSVEGICDCCWGSGRKDHPWTDLRKLQDEGARRDEEAGAQWFVGQLGAKMSTARGGLLAVARKLRRVRGLEFWAQRTADLLADLLDRMAESSKGT